MDRAKGVTQSLTKRELWDAGDAAYETWVDELVRMGDPFADNPKDSARMTWRAGFETACRFLLGDEFD